jgi:hypothetical protein
MKIGNWTTVDAAQVGGGDFLGAGGYVMRIVRVIDHPEDEYIDVVVDVAEGEHAGIYAGLPESDDWRHSYRRYYSDKAASFFKQFLEALEISNRGRFSIEAWQQRMDYNAATILQLQEILKATWGKDTALAQMKQDLVVLDQKIAKTVGLTEEEQKAMQKDDKAVLPYQFERDRGEYSVNFKRDLLSLVSIKEMRDMADDICYASRVRDWSGYREIPKPDRDIEVIFHNANYPDAFILKALDLQHQREKDADWLSSKAAEDTNGNEATQENETIFAARRMMKSVKQAA